MPLEIRFELKDSDLDRFRELFQAARARAAQTDASRLLKTAEAKIASAIESDPPDFVRLRIDGLRQLVEMVQDAAWDLAPEDRERIMDALAYFSDADDAIPDTTPALGFLDDAIAADIVLGALQHELDAYHEFTRFRTGEIQRRINAGQSTDVSTEDWLADQRATLHSRMRRRRVEDTQGWHTITLWGND